MRIKVEKSVDDTPRNTQEIMRPSSEWKIRRKSINA